MNRMRRYLRDLPKLGGFRSMYTPVSIRDQTAAFRAHPAVMREAYTARVSEYLYAIGQYLKYPGLPCVGKGLHSSTAELEIHLCLATMVYADTVTRINRQQQQQPTQL